MKKLDLTPRSGELLARAYALASRVFARAPWKDLDERQLLVIQLKDGRRRVLSVMGELGTYLAIALYPSFAEFDQICSMNNQDLADIQDAFYGLNQLQVAFSPANELQDGEMKDIRASGVKFKRGFNPTFVSYVAGFAPARMGGEELAETVEILEAFLNYLEKFGTESLPIVAHCSQLLPTWTEDDSGNWKKGKNDFSPCLPVAVGIDEALVKKVAALPVKKGFSLEVGAFAVPCGSAVDKRVKMSRLILLVDAKTSLSLGTTIVASPDDAEFDWSEAVEFVLKSICQMACRPAELAVFGRSLRGVFKNLTKRSFTGTRFCNDDPCEAAREVFEFISARM